MFIPPRTLFTSRRNTSNSVIAPLMSHLKKSNSPCWERFRELSFHLLSPWKVVGHENSTGHHVQHSPNGVLTSPRQLQFWNQLLTPEIIFEDPCHKGSSLEKEGGGGGGGDWCVICPKGQGVPWMLHGHGEQQRPVLRSGRQSSITLSTAEAELNELIEGMNAGEAVSVILQELFDEVHSSLTCRHLQGARVSQTRGRPIPGSPLDHTDERCPWINEMKQTPFCLTCREREGVVWAKIEWP